VSRRYASATERDFAQTVADAVKAGRVERGWSQEHLARRAGVSSANIRRLESGTSPATSFVTIGRLARCLAVSLDELFSHFQTEDDR
jgi:transcriptional regulator with XRE-family HTH domain